MVAFEMRFSYTSCTAPPPNAEWKDTRLNKGQGTTPASQGSQMSSSPGLYMGRLNGREIADRECSDF